MAWVKPVTCHCRLVTVRLHITNVYKVIVLDIDNIFDFVALLFVARIVKPFASIMVLRRFRFPSLVLFFEGILCILHGEAKNSDSQ